MLTQYNISDLLEQFQEAYPNIQLNLQEADGNEAKELLRQYALDFAFVRENPSPPPDEFTRLSHASDRLAVVLPATHPLASQKTVALRQLAGERFLLLQSNTFMYTLCINECKKAGFEPNVVFHGAMAANIVDLVQKGRGISLLTRSPVEPLLTPDLVLIDIEPAVITDINLIYLRSRHLSKAAEQFLEFCHNVCGNPDPDN